MTITINGQAVSHEQLVEQLMAAHESELGSSAEANEAAINVDILLGTAFDSNDSTLIKLCCNALGKRSGDAELTFRGNLGRIMAMPSTGLDSDPVRVLTGDPKSDKKRGEKFYRGLVRKYLNRVKDDEGIMPKERIKWVVGGGESGTIQTMQDALLHIDQYLKQPKITKIEDYFNAAQSIEKATKLYEADNYSGDLDVARERAEAIKAAVEAFLTASGS